MMTLDIPNYRILEKLGVGAQTRIFRARCMRTGQDYAVKIVKIQTPEDLQIANLLRAEYAIGSTIDHPAIRKVYELRMIRQRFRVRGAILFMEYVDGISMGEKEFDRPVEAVMRLFMEAAEGLDAMHRAGYVHADLKPNNLMVMPNESVKLIDFGQSCRLNEAKSRIQGTVDYISPEQVNREKLDARTDVFGLGAALYRVLTGESIATDMNQTVNLNNPSLRRRVSRNGSTEELPPALRLLIEDCCAREPKNRLPNMQAFISRAELVLTNLKRGSMAPEELAALLEDEYEGIDDAGMPYDELDWIEDAKVDADKKAED
jgi:serine/threonine protein kinase